MFPLLGLSLFTLVKGADYFIEGAKEIGRALGMSAFVIGVFVVGFGTSLPELAASLIATIQNANDFAVATVVGSNVANILLISGLLITLGGRIVIERDIIKTELPIFFIATVLFVYVARDAVITRPESLLLIATFFAYVWYLLYEAKSIDSIKVAGEAHQKFSKKSFLFLLGGLVTVLVGAHYTVETVLSIARLMSVPASFITISAVALGTSLPELVVSLRSLVHDGGIDLAIGNIFGSNVFNTLLVIGLPGLFHVLSFDSVINSVGIPAMIAASGIFFVLGLGRQFLRWQGFVFLAFFLLFSIELVATVL